MDYTGVTDYFAPCVAKSTCGLLVAWQPTTCNETDFLKRSNYMIMDYKCIGVTDILPVTFNDMRSGPPSTLGNPGYPSSSLPANVDGVCCAWAPCDTTIHVIAIDVELQSSTGTCQQNIDIEDGGVVTRTINCVDNNGYKPKTLYTSRTNFIILKYTNSLAVDGGRLWIEFNGTHSGTTIDLRCGTSALTTSPGVSGCTSTTTSASVVTSTATAGNNIYAETTLGAGKISGIVLGLLVLLFIILLMVCLIKKKQKENMKVSDSSPGVVAGVAPVSTNLT